MSDKNEYMLIGADQSMFTQKVRAYLRNNSIPFKDVLSNVKIFKTVILPNAPYPLIPDLLIVDKETKKYSLIQDSKSIIDFLESTHGLPHVAGTKRAFADMLLEMILDDFFFLHVMNWRWDRPSQQKYLEYTFGDNSQPYEIAKKNGARVLNLIGGRTPSLGLTRRTAEAFNDQLDTFLELLTQHLETYQFILGSQLSRADYSIHGHFSAGLFRDPAPYEWAASNYPVVLSYVRRVSGTAVSWGSKDVVQLEATEDTIVTCEDTMGKCRGDKELETSDMIPETTTRMTALLLRDYLSILAPTVNMTIEFLNNQAGKDEVIIPRGFKADQMYEFTLHTKDGKEIKEKRIVTAHCVWMLQRILDATYRPEQRGEVDKWLAEVGYMNEWKNIVAAWEASGWRIDMTRKGTVASRKSSLSRL
ncbi:hypothetical protein Dda_5309 [Drechslerella dactyloides]|uniref:GST N-terminal domain-containing protein n=1 Tax=Drechslerella dactyloides TaxID=74499 RepID=A0AAD6IWB8_DREDA|nr:hypothetical protein Dda_5309 [Drechslerella dactyloides]